MDQLQRGLTAAGVFAGVIGGLAVFAIAIGPDQPAPAPTVVHTLPRTYEPDVNVRYRPTPTPTAEPIEEGPAEVEDEQDSAVVVDVEHDDDGESRFCSRRWWC